MSDAGKPTTLKDLYAEKKPFPKFQVAFEDHAQGGAPKVVKLEMAALNVMCLYVQLVSFIPMLRQMGVMRFWIVDAEGKELLADCSLDAIGASLQQIFGNRIIAASDELMKRITRQM